MNKDKNMRKSTIDLIQQQLSLPSKEKEEECPYSHEPNAETIKAIKDARARKNVKEAKSLDDLFKKLGL